MEIVPVLSGGGTRLPAHLGVLTALEELNINMPVLVGVSGGSIIAALYASHHPLKDLRNVSKNTDFKQFINISAFSIFSLLKSGGLCSGDKFEKWIDSMLKGATFSQLNHILYIVATDVTENKPILFSKFTTPTVKISFAVRCSVGIPLIFSYKSYGDNMLIDGSMLAERILHQNWNTEIPYCVFKIRSKADKKTKIMPKTWLPLTTYLPLLTRTFMNTMDAEYIDDKLWDKTIVIDDLNTSPINFSLSHEEKEQLFISGYNSVKTALPLKYPQFSE